MENDKKTCEPQPVDEAARSKAFAGISRRHFGKATLAASAGFLLPRMSFGVSQAPAPRATPPVATNVVLVHGAWADGSSWSKVIPQLEAKGINITAVQIPLTSLADDVATARRELARQRGPTILVGHSYAGFVVTEAGNAPNVVGLVYVSSYGPAEGESHDDLVKKVPAPPGASVIRLGEDGFLLIERDQFASAWRLGILRGNPSPPRFCFRRTTAWSIPICNASCRNACMRRSSRYRRATLLSSRILAKPPSRSPRLRAMCVTVQRKVT